MNDLLAAADVLVTDYSSVIFEFALLRRPVVFFTPDLDEYAASRAFYRPFEEYAIGPVVRDAAGLADAIRSAAVDESAPLDASSRSSAARSTAHRAPASPRPPWPDGGDRSAGATRRIGGCGLDLLAAYAARLALTVVVSSHARAAPPRQGHDDHARASRARRWTSPPDRRHRTAWTRRSRSSMIARMVPPGIVRKLGYALTLLTELYHVSTSRVLVVDGYSIVASAVRTATASRSCRSGMHSVRSRSSGSASWIDPRDATPSSRARCACTPTTTSSSRAPSAVASRSPRRSASILARSSSLRSPASTICATSPRESRARARFAAMYPELKGQPIVVFAPTFRAHGTEPAIDPLELTEALAADGYATITKLHPILPQPVHPALRTAPGMSTQDLLLVADVFITDYSSAVFEAAVAGVPFVPARP